MIVGENKYCVLNSEVKENTYNIDEKQIYTLNDLLAKYSTTLEVRDRVVEQGERQEDLWGSVIIYCMNLSQSWILHEFIA